VLDDVRSCDCGIRGMSFVDANGTVIEQHTDHTVTGGTIDSPDIELLRDDLLRILHPAAAHPTYLFGDTLVDLDNSDGSVSVRFEHAATQSFDLVVGADGAHSQIRALGFGPESQFANKLHRFVASCSVPNFLGLEDWQTWHRNESTQIMAGACSIRDNTEARAFLAFTDTDWEFDWSDTTAQRAEIRRRFDCQPWILPRIAQAMQTARDFYCDEMVQIVMPRWSTGRLVLVGDAAYCASPLSGQGTSVAIVGAYVLANTLVAAWPDYRVGLQAYEDTLRDYAKATQQLAFDEDLGQAAIPEEVRREIINSISLRPPGLFSST
jgi:2-polyprenyl-6-methoxyphenol hydroxylase-like FAD-dependent oxidoreductase